MEASQEQRNTYQELIKGIKPQSIVYIDESGIELSICKDRGWGKKVKSWIKHKITQFDKLYDALTQFFNT